MRHLNMADLNWDEGVDVVPIGDHYDIDAEGIANDAAARYTAYIHNNPLFTVENVVQAYNDFDQALPELEGSDAVANQFPEPAPGILEGPWSRRTAKRKYLRTRISELVDDRAYRRRVVQVGDLQFIIPPSSDSREARLTSGMPYVAAMVFERVKPLWRGYNRASWPDGLDMDAQRHSVHNVQIIEAEGMLPTANALISLIIKHFPWMSPTLETIVPDRVFYPDEHGPRSWTRLTITGAFVDMSCASNGQ